MRQVRTTNEVIVDEALTLSLLAEVENVPGSQPTDRLRLQKLIFWVAYEWFQERWKGFNYTFFRYRRGPFTKDLYQTEVDLAEAGFVQGGPNWKISLTDEGREFAELLIENVWMSDENDVFWSHLQRVIAELAPLPTADLVQRVYELEVMPIGWREAWPLSDVPLGVDLVRILEEQESYMVIEMSPEWLDTAGLTFARQTTEPQVGAHAV